MSSDDSDPDHGDAEASQSGPDGDDGGQPRDPETGRFLSKDERGAAATDDEAEPSEPDRDDTATERDAPGRSSGSDPADPGPDTRRPGPAQRTGTSLRITRLSVRSGGGPPSNRSTARAAEPVLPPSLHLVPMQVQFTGESVRVGPTASGPVERDGDRRRPRRS